MAALSAGLPRKPPVRPGPHQLDRSGSRLVGDRPYLAPIDRGPVGGFYTWLPRKFPHDEDEKPPRLPCHGPREYVARFRDGVLAHLDRRGTPASLEAIGEIARQFPHLSWLPLVRLQAEKVMMERSWTPHRPEDLWALTKDREARLVDGGDQLLDVVAESLADSSGGSRARPRRASCFGTSRATADIDPEEERLSDALKLHLHG